MTLDDPLCIPQTSPAHIEDRQQFDFINRYNFSLKNEADSVMRTCYGKMS